MPVPDTHSNFAYSTVATAPSPASSGTSLVVAAGQGALFPAVPFNATVWPTAVQPTSTNAEIVRVTARATDTLTIVRAQESSSARTVVVGDQIAATVTAKTLTDAENVVVSTIAATGSTETVDLTVASVQDLTLDANCTLTLTGATTGKAGSLTLLLRQDGTGGRTVTWPGSVTWLSGAVPVLHSAPSALDVISLFTVDGGTTWYGAQVAAPVGYLGSAQITGPFTTTSSSAVQVTSLSATVTIPGGTHIKVTCSGQALANNTVNCYCVLEVWEGTVGSGTLVGTSVAQITPAGGQDAFTVIAVYQPSAGSKTYNVSLRQAAGGTARIEAGTGAPCLLLVESI